jgi:hypothetical protein
MADARGTARAMEVKMIIRQILFIFDNLLKSLFESFCEAGLK